MTDLSLKDRNLRFVVLKAIVDAATAELGALRTDHLPVLLEQYRATEATSFKVRVPGVDGAPGPVVATVSLAVPKPKMEIHDQDEFLDWVQANHPKLVDVEVIPGVPEHTVVVPATQDATVRTLDPKGWAALSKHFEPAEEGGIVDLATGVMVDGVIVNPGGAPKSFAVKYEAGADEQLVASYRAGRLDAVVAGTSLPEVATRVVVERHLEVVAPAPARVPVAEQLCNQPDCMTCRKKRADKAAAADVDVPQRGEFDEDRAAAVVASLAAPAAEPEPFEVGDWGAASHAADPWG